MQFKLNYRNLRITDWQQCFFLRDAHTYSRQASNLLCSRNDLVLVLLLPPPKWWGYRDGIAGQTQRLLHIRDMFYQFSYVPKPTEEMFSSKRSATHSPSLSLK